jgi:hypothetical protein
MMKRWGSSMRMKMASRGLLGIALLSGVLAGCGMKGYGSEEHPMSVRVVNRSLQPQEGLSVTVWVVDEDARGTTTEIVELEPAWTDADGVASFVFTAMLPPYVCGYRIEDPTGAVLLSELPSPSRRMSGDDGDLLLTL